MVRECSGLKKWDGNHSPIFFLFPGYFRDTVGRNPSPVDLVDIALFTVFFKSEYIPTWLC